MKSRLCIREDAQPVFLSVCGGRPWARAEVSKATRGVAKAPRHSKMADAVWRVQAVGASLKLRATPKRLTR